MRVAAASLWVVLAGGSLMLWRVEVTRQRAVEEIAARASIAERNPVATEVIRLARDPDHAAAAFARAALIDAVVQSRGTAPATVSKRVLERSITAYLTPDRHPRGSYGAELLSNQGLLARSQEDDAPRATAAIVESELTAARGLALEGLRMRPGFQDYVNTLRALDVLEHQAGNR